MDDLRRLRQYAREGDEEAFREVVERHAPLVYSSALRQLGDHSSAQEVSQAVFIALARKAGRLREGTVVAAWLLRAVRFAVLHVRRDAARRPQFEPISSIDPLPARSSMANDADADWRDMASVLDEALAGLPAREREAIVLRYYQEMSVREVAEAQGTSEEAAKKRLQRGLDHLRNRMRRRKVVLSTTATLAALAHGSVQSAPVELVHSIVAAARAPGTDAPPEALHLAHKLMKTLLWQRLRWVAWAGVVALLVAPVATRTWSAPVPGTLDASFIRTNAPGLISQVAIQPDGKILILAATPDFVNNGNLTETGRSLFRLRPDGSRDPDFQTGKDYIADAFALLPDGSIVVGGSLVQVATARRITVFKLHPNGTRDLSFDAGPGSELDTYLQNAISLRFSGIATQANGTILATGNFLEFGGRQRGGVVRLMPSGAIDPGFQSETIVGDQVSEPHFQSDGKMLMTVWSAFGETPHPVLGGRTPRIVRLNPDGSEDPSFRMTWGQGALKLVCVQPDDRLLCIGWDLSQVKNLVRLHPDGSRDASYSAQVRRLGSGSASIDRAVVQPDGKTLVLGIFTRAGGIERRGLARFNTDGSLDTSFDAGMALSNFDSAYYRALALQEDRQVIVAGSFPLGTETRSTSIARFAGDAPRSSLFGTVSGTTLNLRWEIEGSPSADVEASTDLALWRPLATLTNGVSPNPFVVPLGQGFVAFFRLRSP